MLDRKKQIHQYLVKNVNTFIEPLVLEIVKQRPKDPEQFAITFLTNKINNREKNQNNQSDSQDDEITDIKFEQKKIKKNNSVQGKKRSRFGISEEVFGAFNKKQQFVAKNIQKSEQDKLLILSLLRNSILFQNLDSKDQEIAINAMEQKDILEGQKIISEGDNGDLLYIVQSGQFKCTKIIQGKETFLKNYLYGDAFGELALLYNAPRAATIVCAKKGKLYALDRSTFSNVVKNSNSKKRQLYLSVLNKIDIFSNTTSDEKQQFCDVLKEQKYQSGQYIIKQGQSGDRFYIIIEGKLVAEKIENNEQKVVFHYKQGNYFGQLALIHDSARQASIKALTLTRVASINREAFKRILGNLEDILKRNEEKYKLFLQQQQTS